MNKQRICPHCRSHPTLELAPRALTRQNKAPSGLSFARGRLAWIARLRQPLGLYAVDVCNACLRALRRLVPPSPACGMVTISHTARFPARSKVHVSRAQVSDCWRARMRADSAQRVRRRKPGRHRALLGVWRPWAQSLQAAGRHAAKCPPRGHRAHPLGYNARHICTGTGLAPATSAHGTGLAPATSGRDHLDSALCATVVRERCVCRTGRAGLLSAGRVSHTCAATVGSLPRWGTTDCRGAIESTRVPGSAMRWADRRTRRPLTHHSFPPCCRPPAHLRRSHTLRHKWVGPVPPVDHRALAQVQHECAACRGTGKIIHRHCHKCGGDKERRRRVRPRPPLPARAGALLCTSGSSCEDGRIGAIRSCRRPREHATDGWARARSCSQ